MSDEYAKHAEQLKQLVAKELKKLNFPTDNCEISISKGADDRFEFTAFIPISGNCDLNTLFCDSYVTVEGYITPDKRIRFTKVGLRFYSKKARGLAYSKILPKIKEIIMIFKLL